MKILLRLLKSILFLLTLITLIPELLFYGVRYILIGKSFGYPLFVEVLDRWEI